MAVIPAEIQIIIKARDEAAAALKGVASELGAIDDATKKAGKSLDDIERQAGKAGLAMSAAFTVPFAAISKAAFDVTSDYQKNMALFQAVTRASGEEMDKVADLAKGLGADMSLPATSAGDAAAAMTELAKAGLSVEQSMAAARGVLQLSAASGVDNARAAEIAANALNSFRLDGSKAADVANLLANAANASSIEITDAADSLKMAAAVFSSFQGPVVGSEQALKDLTVAIGLLGNQGIKGSDAGTSLKQALLQLTGPSQKAKDQMEALYFAAQGAAISEDQLAKVIEGGAKARGAALKEIRSMNAALANGGDIAFDATGKMRPFREIVELVGVATAGMSDEMRDAALTTIFGADATRSIIALLQQGADGWDAMAAALDRQGGAADLANARMTGIGGALEGLKSQFETTALVIGEKFAPMIEGLIRSTATFVGAIGNLPEPILVVGVSILAILAVIGPLALAFSGILSVASAVGTLFSALGVVFGAVIPIVGGVAAVMSGPLLLVIAAVAAAIGVLVLAWSENWGDIQGVTSSAVAAVVGFIVDQFGDVQDWFDENWPLIEDLIAGPLELARQAIEALLPAMQALFELGFGAIKTTVSTAWDVLTIIIRTGLAFWMDIITAFLQLLHGNWGAALLALQDAFSVSWEGMGAILQVALASLWNTLVFWVQQFNPQAAEQMRGFGENFVRGFWAGVQGLQEWLMTQLTGFADAIPGPIREALGIHSPSEEMALIGANIVAGLALGLQDQAQLAAVDAAAVAMVTRITTLLATVVTGVDEQGNADPTKSPLYAIGASIIDGLRAGAESAWSGAQGNDGLLAFFSGIPQQIVNAISGIDSSGASDAIAAAVDGTGKDGQSAASDTASMLGDAGFEIMMGFEDGLQEGFSEVQQWLIDQVTTAFQIVGSYWGSTIGQEWGRDSAQMMASLGQGFSDGVSSDLQPALEAITRLLEDFAQLIADTARDMEEAGRAMSEGLGRGIQTGSRSALDALRGIEEAVQRTVQVVQQAVSQLQGLAGQIQGIAAQIQAAAATASFGAASVRGVGGFTAFASGGVITEPIAGIGLASGRRYLMGEAGPEAVVPLKQMGNGGGGGSISVTVNGVGIDEVPAAVVRKINQASWLTHNWGRR